MNWQVHCNVRIALCLTALAALNRTVRAGDLTPPSGLISPTFKTLTEIEPRTAISPTNTPGDADSLFRITQPGSYYLTGNVTGVAGKHGIEIAVSGVTLDLNGFDLVGVPGSLDGLTAEGNGTSHLAVANGSVRIWGQDGVDLSLATFSLIRDLRALGNSGNGISAGIGSQITGCIGSANTAHGIQTANACTIIHCTVDFNGQNGINAVGFGGLVTACSASGNAIGIRANARIALMACAANANTIGISANSATVSGCTSTGNSTDGIQAASNCLIIDNTCSTNSGGAGIRVSGSDNRIERNNCTDSIVGINVLAGGNVVVRNSCSGNTTNWTLAAGNAVAPIVAATTNAAAIAGNAFAGSLGTTDPNANFTY